MLEVKEGLEEDEEEEALVGAEDEDVASVELVDAVSLEDFEVDELVSVVEELDGDAVVCGVVVVVGAA
jgi:hypothetical protein